MVYFRNLLFINSLLLTECINVYVGNDEVYQGKITRQKTICIRTHTHKCLVSLTITKLKVKLPNEGTSGAGGCIGPFNASINDTAS